MNISNFSFRNVSPSEIFSTLIQIDPTATLGRNVSNADTKTKNAEAPEVYLKPSRTSTIELFCVNR